MIRLKTKDGRLGTGFTLIKDFVASMVGSDKISSNRKSYGFTLMADFFGRKRSSESKALIKDFVASIVKNDKKKILLSKKKKFFNFLLQRFPPLPFLRGVWSNLGLSGYFF